MFHRIISLVYIARIVDIGLGKHIKVKVLVYRTNRGFCLSPHGEFGAGLVVFTCGPKTNFLSKPSLFAIFKNRPAIR